MITIRARVSQTQALQHGIDPGEHIIEVSPSVSVEDRTLLLWATREEKGERYLNDTHLGALPANGSGLLEYLHDVAIAQPVEKFRAQYIERRTEGMKPGNIDVDTPWGAPDFALQAVKKAAAEVAEQIEKEMGETFAAAQREREAVLAAKKVEEAEKKRLRDEARETYVLQGWTEALDTLRDPSGEVLVRLTPTEQITVGIYEYRHTRSPQIDAARQEVRTRRSKVFRDMLPVELREQYDADLLKVDLIDSHAEEHVFAQLGLEIPRATHLEASDLAPDDDCDHDDLRVIESEDTLSPEGFQKWKDTLAKVEAFRAFYADARHIGIDVTHKQYKITCRDCDASGYRDEVAVTIRVCEDRYTRKFELYSNTHF